MIHVRELTAGNQVRVVLKAGHQLEPDPFGAAAPPLKPRHTRGYSVTTFYGFVLSNDPLNGTMTLDLQRGPNAQHVTGTVPYKGIKVLQLVVSKGRPVVETAPKIHPGAKALGTRMAQLFQQPYLIPVSFCGH